MQSAHLQAFGDESETVIYRKVSVICSLSGPLEGTRKHFFEEGLCILLTFGSSEKFSGPLRRAPERFFGCNYGAFCNFRVHVPFKLEKF